MMTFQEVLVAFAIERFELVTWIEQAWVRPLRQGDDWHFDDLDVARLQLICELKRELAVNDDAVPLVLELLDQLYATRATLARVRAALDRMTEPAAAELLALLDEGK